MARPKAFAVDTALDAAVEVFWRKGYDGTSLDDLVAAMGIGRQSLYDTFGDKQALYRRALEAYRERGRAFVEAHLHAAADPLAGIRALLMSVAERDPRACRRGCLLLNAAGDAERDPDIARQVALNRDALLAAFEIALRRASAAGNLPAGRDPAALARGLLVTFFGLVAAARAGLDPASRRLAVEQAVRALAG